MLNASVCYVLNASVCLFGKLKLRSARACPPVQQRFYRQLSQAKAEAYRVCRFAFVVMRDANRCSLGYTHLAERAGSILQMNTELDVRSLTQRVSHLQIWLMYTLIDNRNIQQICRFYLPNIHSPPPKHSPSSVLSACDILPPQSSSGYSTSTLPALFLLFWPTCPLPPAVSHAPFSNIFICNTFIYYYGDYVLLQIIFIIY